MRGEVYVEKTTAEFSGNFVQCKSSKTSLLLLSQMIEQKSLFSLVLNEQNIPHE